MTAAPRWQWQRAEWSKVTDGIHARRRARAREAFNALRREQALRRRQALWECINRLSDGGRRPVRAVDVWRAFQQEWVCCVRTFWEDWRWLKERRFAFPSRALQRTERASQAATHRSLWLSRYAALAAAVARYCSPEQQHAVQRLAAQLVEQWTPLPRAGAVFDGREAFVPVVPGAGPSPASPASPVSPAPRHTGASTPPPASLTPETPEAPRVGRPAEFSGQPGTAARLVRQPHHPRQAPREREREWWES